MIIPWLQFDAPECLAILCCWSYREIASILCVNTSKVDHRRRLCLPDQPQISQSHFTLPNPHSRSPRGLKISFPPPELVCRRSTRCSLKLTRVVKAGYHSARPTDTDTALKRAEPVGERWQSEYLRFPDCAHSLARWRRVCGGQWGSSISPHGLQPESSQRLS